MSPVAEALAVMAQAKGEIERLRAVLDEIANAHLGDCPAAMDPMSHARAHIQYLRKLALAALTNQSA